MKTEHHVAFVACFMFLFIMFVNRPTHSEMKTCEEDNAQMQDQLNHFNQVELCSEILAADVTSSDRRAAMCTSMMKYVHAFEPRD